MEKYNLTQTGQDVQNILNNATPKSDLSSEVERAQEAERLLGEGIQQNADDIDAIEAKIPSSATSENKLTDKAYVDGQVDDEKNRAQGVEDTLQDNIDAEEARAKAAEKQNADDIDAIEEKIPSGATSENKLATESYVNDAVATSSATFRGTFNLVSDLHLTLEATHANIAMALAAAIATADNNDFAFVLIPTDAETPTVIGSIERYKYNGTDWAYEYTLNNSGFTQAQWDAINSGITSGDVAKLAALPTNAQLTTLLTGLQSDIDGEETRAKAAELAIQGNIDAEEARAKAEEKQNADDIDAIEAVLPENASSENKVATESEIDSLSAAIEAILLLIPSAATSLNKLADKAFVNSSIATATATFRGTYNLVDDLGLTTSATHAQIATALAGAILTANNNDYAFVQIPTSTAMPTEIAKTERYKFNGTAWEYEYDLNNSGFTADQWAAINSGITQALVTKLSALPTNAQLTTELGTLTSGITTINQKIPNAASQANKLVDTAAMESYIVEVLNVLTISYNVTSTDGHVTFHIEQVDGKITSVTLATSDIASAAALNLKASQADLTALEGRVTTAEGNITTLNGNLTSLTGRVSTNETDIAQLQDAYEALTQSDIIIGALPASGVANKIYRVPGTSSYSDYMWNGSTWVLMATYNNAIDPRPKKASQNLVTSGGVFDNMGALDVSELNATENPHTLAQYVNLSAAIAAIPTDYQKGGMSIKYVRSSDNKYVQYRLMSDTFNTTVANWQGVDDEPTAGSDNLVKSGGIYKNYTSVGKSINPVSVLNSVKLTVSGNTLTFESGGNSLVCYKKYQRNEVFNFYQRTVAGVISLLDDDVAPVHVAIGEDKQYTVIGANHGWPYAIKATITAHGKTNADIGTLWEDSQNHKYVLADIVNANTITFLPQNNGSYINIDLEPGMTAGTITCNGNTMNVSNVDSDQLRNSVSNKTLHIYDSNNEEIIDDGVYEADYFDVKESYDITNLASIISNLISRQSQTPKPTTTPDYSGMAMLNVDNTYRIGNNTTVVVEATVSPKHLVYLNGGDIMFTQAQYLITGEENIKYYVPGSKPYGRNLTTPTPWVFNQWAFEAVRDSFADVNKPINRIIQYAQAYGFALGYLNYAGVGKNIMSYTSMPLKVRGDSGKIYPHGIDGAKIGTTINVPSKYTAVMYRAVVDYSTKNANRLSYYTVDAPNGYLYLYIDYSASTNDTVIINDKYNGKSIEVVESSNCKLLYDVYYGGIFIKSTYITDRTSYIIVRISNS